MKVEITVDTGTAVPTKEEKEDGESEQPLVVTRDDAAALMRILMARGYFNEDAKLIRSEEVEFRSKAAANTKKYSEEDALLIQTSQKSFVKFDTLKEQFTVQLNARGRWGIKDAAELLTVSVETLLRRIVPRVVAQDSESFTVLYSANGNVKEILCATYLNGKTDALWSMLHQFPESGIISVAEAAESIYNLPVEMTLPLVEKRISASSTSDVQILLKDNASKVLVTESYLELLKDRIAEAFRVYKDAPVEVKVIAKTNGWEVGWVMRIVKEGLTLPGEFHGETYVPSNFTESKRRSVTDSFATNGYVTSHMCHTMFGILPSQMKEYATAGDSATCLVLENSVVHKDVIVAPLVESAREAADSASWMDLQLHLPVELLEHQTDDARMLVEDHLLGQTAGVACVRSDGALFFSQPMIDAFAKTNIPGLIKAYANSRSNELLSSVDDHANESGGGHGADDDDLHMTGKEKRKTRKAAKSKRAEDNDTEIQATEYGTVPLDDIVRAVLEVHPDLSSDLDSATSVLAETCKLAFCTDSFETLCADAVRAELARLQLEKKTKSANRNDAPLGDFRRIMAAFEDPGCFATACYMVQAKAKFITHAVDSAEPLEDETKGALVREFLTGCCADFTSRVTQYALFKNDVDDGIFSFRSDQNCPTSFFAPIDLAVRSYGTVYLSCSPEKAGKRRDPLSLLREELPDSAGVALARQWILCGGECYQGGVKASGNNGEAYTRPAGDVDAFLTHVRENCLAICGLPFSHLDKKSEKKVLNARRLRLTQLLEEATDAGTVLDLRIMLLYQLVKNVVVSGPLLRGPILRMLAKERKVSDSESAELLEIAEKLEKGEDIDAAFVERMKDCALTKHKS